MDLRNRVSAAVTAVTEFAGTATAIFTAMATLVAWGVVGVLIDFEHHWLEVLHAFTGAVTFLMVFLLRHAEGRENRAMLLKLDELVAAVEGAKEDVIGIEKDDLDRQEQAEDRPVGA